MESIKSDLIDMEEKQFYLKYIIKSNNWYFTEFQHTPGNEFVDKMDTFKEIIAKCFGVSFHSAQIVGSAKLGFSLSPEKSLKKFIAHASNKTEKESDIDIAIISEKLYYDIWEKLREGIKSSFVPYYSNIANSIFKGYINDKHIKNLDFFRKEWEEKISASNIRLQEEISIMHTISYRIYRSWEDLQDYQIDGIMKVKEKVIKNEI